MVAPALEPAVTTPFSNCSPRPIRLDEPRRRCGTHNRVVTTVGFGPGEGQKEWASEHQREAHAGNRPSQFHWCAPPFRTRLTIPPTASYGQRRAEVRNGS